MKTSGGYVTRGRVALLLRVARVVIVLCGLAGLLLFLAPLPEPPALHNVVAAAAHEFANDKLLFPQYHELTAARTSPFEFQALTLAQVKIRPSKPDPNEPPPPPPPPPKPDIGGLTLVGTAPGNPREFAMLHDQQDNRIIIVTREEQVRNSVVKAIHHDRIVFALDEEEAELVLAAIPGSEDFDRQLRGLSPLPRAERASTPPARAANRQLPHTQRGGSNAVLTGASTGGSGRPATVITQAPTLGSQSGQSTGSGGQRGRPGGQPTPPGQSAPGGGRGQPAPPGQATPGGSSGQSTPGTSSEQSASPDSSAPSQRRSLGISGHMLGAAKQQEMGLQQTGLLITAVRSSNSPLQVGDVVLAIAGKSFTNLGEAKGIINGMSSSTVPLRVFRNGSTTQVTANLGEG